MDSAKGYRVIIRIQRELEKAPATVGISRKSKETQKKPLSPVAAGKMGDPKRASIVKAQINYTTYPLLFLYPKYK